MNLDVNKQILDVIIKAKSKLTRTVNVKDNHSKVLSKFVPKLKVSDRISNSNSPYTNDNQCNNIAYLAPSRNKIQLSICNQRKVINNPLVVDNNISTCRLTLSNERTSFNFNMIVPSGVDLQKEKRNSHPIKNMALTQKEKDASLNIRSNIMISNHNTIISITLRKKLNNDLLPNNDTNPIKANSHNTITKNKNTNNILNQQHVQKQIYQSTPDSNTPDSVNVTENDSPIQVTSKEMSEDSPTLEKATDQLCIDEVEIETEEDKLSDQVDVASSSDNDKIKVTETIEGTVLAGKSLSIDETESLKMSSNDTNNNVKGKQALSTVTEKKTEELSAVEKCSQIVDVKNKKSNNSNSNVKVEKKLTIEDTNDKEQNLDKKELLECEVTEHYTLEDLQVPIKGVDWKKREFYLTQEDFQNIFKITLEEYKDLKPWKRMQCKKNAGLF